MMSVEARKRFSFAQIRQHPWYTRNNRFLTEDGQVSDPLNLATKMLENLRIDFSQPSGISSSQRQSQSQSQSHDAMDIDSSPPGPAAPANSDAAPGLLRVPLSATQPETPISDALFDWERPVLHAHRALGVGGAGVLSTQPVSRDDVAIAEAVLAGDPAMSQFSQAPGVPLTLTQRARRFRDIVPPHGLTRFLSHVPARLLVRMLADALHNINVPLPAGAGTLGGDNTAAAAAANNGNSNNNNNNNNNNSDRGNGGNKTAPAVDSNGHITTLKVRTLDTRRQGLHGEIIVERYHIPENLDLLEARFVKVKGDPLEWRRFFKRVVVMCKDGVYKPGA